MTIQSKERRFSNARKAIAVVAIFGFLALGAFGQEGGKIADPKPADKAAAAGAPAPGMLLDWTGVARVGNPYDEPSKDGKRVVPVVFTRLEEKTPDKYKKLVGGSVYFAVFKNMGAAAKEGDTFGTGMKGLDKRFSGGDGFQFSPGFDTSANYLYLYQVVNGRGLDGRNFIAEPIAQKDRLTEKDVIKDFQRVSPPTEAIARWALSLAVRPRDISSWGYFNGAAFVAQERKSLNLFGEETKVPTTIKPISFLPSMLEETHNPAYKNRAPAQSLGALQPTFQVGDSRINLDKSPAYPGNDNAIKFAVSADAKEKIKFPIGIDEQGKPLSTVLFSSYSEKSKKFQYDVNPSSVQIMYDATSDLLRAGYAGYGYGGYTNDDFIRSVLLVKFDDEQGLKKGQYSVVFGFTSNMPPRPERVRIDTEESVRESRPYENRPADLFSRQQVDAAESVSSMILLAAAGKQESLPALKAFSREPGMIREVGDVGVGVFGVGGVGGVGTLRTAAEIFVADGAIRTVAANEPREVPGPAAGGPGGGAAITGGFSTGLGGISSGGGMGGGLGLPSLGVGGAAGLSGAIGGGGGIGGSTSGTNGQNQQPGTQTGTQSGNQTINFTATLTNQQKQQQQQQQFQSQHQNQHQENHNNHNHNNHHPHGAVVPAPASLLLGLLGLPVLLFLRRRKTEETPLTPEAVA
jgi:hypothetical protein